MEKNLLEIELEHCQQNNLRISVFLTNGVKLFGHVLRFDNRFLTLFNGEMNTLSVVNFDHIISVSSDESRLHNDPLCL